MKIFQTHAKYFFKSFVSVHIRYGGWGGGVGVWYLKKKKREKGPNANRILICLFNAEYTYSTCKQLSLQLRVPVHLLG